MNVTHTWINDLTATLISPSGTEVQLYARPCTDTAIKNINAAFDDAGIALVCGTNPGISGTVQPKSALSAFNGLNSTGTWTLKISDAFNQDGGILNSWSLNICTLQPLSVEENAFQNFVLFPNPNQGNFTIQFNPSSSNEIVILVHDIMGRKILNNRYPNRGQFSQNLQLENAQSGVYLVTVQEGEQRVVKRIVIE